MAIDMIENNELGALSQSRLGNKCFVNDSQYANILGLNFDILGVKSRKRKTQEAVTQRTQEYAIDKIQSTDCNYLQQRLQEVKNKIAYELAKNPNKIRRQRYLDPLYASENNFKDAILKNKCEEKQSQAEEEKFKRETEEAIKRTASDTPNIPDVKIAKGNKTTKIILVAVGLLIVSVVGVALFRKK